MPNDFYTPTGNPSDNSNIVSADMRAEFAAINAGFNKLPTLTGNANKAVVVNASGTGLDVVTTLPMISSNNSIGVGTNAGVDLTTGARNTLIGVDAGQNYTAANNATCIGYRAGGVSTGASNHTAIGAYAGEYNTSVNSVHIGHQAGRYAIGAGVVIIGDSAANGAFASAVDNTVAVGAGALGGASFNGAQNIAIGANAGNAISTGTTNTIVGDNSGQVLSTGSNNIILGYGALPTAANVSNQITLGNASINSFRIPGLSLTATGVTGSGSFVLATAPTLTGLTVSGGTFVSRGITDNATATALTLSGSGANSVTIANSATTPTIGTSAGSLAVGSSLTMLQSNLGAFAAGEWSRDANWGTYYKAPVTGLVADIGFLNNAGTAGWGVAAKGAGYTGGSGGEVTQITSRTTGVTLNKPCGKITLVSAAGSTSWQTFTVTNSFVDLADVIIVNQRDGTDLNEIHVTDVSAGSFNISFKTTGGTTVESPVFNFAVIKAHAA